MIKGDKDFVVLQLEKQIPLLVKIFKKTKNVLILQILALHQFDELFEYIEDFYEVAEMDWDGRFEFMEQYGLCK